MTPQDSTSAPPHHLSFVPQHKYENAFYLALILCGMAYFAMYAGAYLGSAHTPYGGIFINTWMSGRAALGGNPAAWFDVHTYNAALRPLFGLPANASLCNWSYPPHIMLFTWIFGFLPYLPAWIFGALLVSQHIFLLSRTTSGGSIT